MPDELKRPARSRNLTACPLVLSCEHATPEIPSAYRHLFEGAGNVLESHLGWDPGACEAALYLRDHFRCFLALGEATRLLVELNRSLHHPQLWSTYSSQLSWVRKEQVLRLYYHPYRERVQAALRSHLVRFPKAIHLSVHSLTPYLDGQHRDFDVALLFDPTRLAEVELCRIWADEMQARNAKLRVVENTPYKGTDDGFTTSLRQVFPAARYLGIEIEFNQALLASRPAWQRLLRLISDAFASTLERILQAP